MSTEQSARLREASIRWDGSMLQASVGGFARHWMLSECGLATCHLSHAGQTWVQRRAGAGDCDWYMWQMITSASRAALTEVVIAAVEDPPLTAPHVRAVVEFTYPAEAVAVRYCVRAYPEAPGVWTQLQVRALRSFEAEALPSHLLECYAEALAMRPAGCVRAAMGYYNDAQHRNHDDTPMLRRERRSGELAEGRREVYDWANVLSLQDGDAGLLLVKESPKCVNQPGIDTGAFVLHPDDVRVTGLGLSTIVASPEDPWLPRDGFRGCWATWCVPYRGEESALQLALKRFDRARFLPYPERFVHSRSNTWGTRPPGDRARAAANQDDVLREIASCADLGIDAVAIDDGWQVPLSGSDGREHDWRPHPERFPEGWGVVRRAAEEAGVELQLWLPGARVTLEQIIGNLDEGGFTGLKIDFLNFPARSHLDRVIDKVDRLVRHTGYNLKISWDVTENASRLGYYFGREYGSLHTSNRKPSYDYKRVLHVTYTPRLVLRDAWHLAHYLNLNQIEIPVQDTSKVDPAIRNASAYSHAYCAAMSVMGLPLFFQETHFLSGGARDQTRMVMTTWREHRQAMARGFVFPVGDEPCDEAWTGFQCHDPERGTGYVLLFRELHNRQREQTVRLHFVDGEPLAWHDLLSGERWRGTGGLTCDMDRAPAFRWLRYESA